MIHCYAYKHMLLLGVLLISWLQQLLLGVWPHLVRVERTSVVNAFLLCAGFCYRGVVSQSLVPAQHSSLALKIT